MATNNAINSIFSNDADGFTLGGGTVARNLSLTRSSVILSGSAPVTLSLQTQSGTVTLQDTATLTEGSIPFADSTGLLSQDNANLFWDNTNDILKLGGEVEFNVDSLGTGVGGRVLADLNSNALIQFGEYSENDTSITSDDGAFAAGGAAFIADSESALYFDGGQRITANVTETKMRTPLPAGFNRGLLINTDKVTLRDDTTPSEASTIFIAVNNLSSISTGATTNQGLFLGSSGSTINSGLTNVVVIGGSGITASLSDTVYTANLEATGRLQEAKGADIASADEITLGTDGNYFDITGTTTINHINKTNWATGSVVALQFDASVTVTHNAAAPSGTEASILLAGAVDFSATANDTLTLRFDGTTFREMARTVI